MVSPNPSELNRGELSGSTQLLWLYPLAAPQAHLSLFERQQNAWIAVRSEIPVITGSAGCALPGQKVEGDLRTPSGIWDIAYAFGYDAQVSTRMPYRQVTSEDKFIDDPHSPDYNAWVRGPTNARSFERMLRDDAQYELGLVLRYNMDPVIPGKGSAIFLHIWKSPQTATAGCIAMAKQDMVEILNWLNPRDHPRVVINPEML